MVLIWGERYNQTEDLLTLSHHLVDRSYSIHAQNTSSALHVSPHHSARRTTQMLEGQSTTEAQRYTEPDGMPRKANLESSPGSFVVTLLIMVLP